MSTWNAAISAAIQGALPDASEPWTGVYKDIAPMNATRPFLVHGLMGGGNDNSIRGGFINARWMVKGIADTQVLAFSCADRIRALLGDADQGSGKALDGGDDWHILTITEGDVIDFIELVDGQNVYHAGYIFRVLMQGKIS